MSDGQFNPNLRCNVHDDWFRPRSSVGESWLAMTTPRYDIAGLSERLLAEIGQPVIYRSDATLREAATQLDSLLKERDALQARVKELERDNGIFRDMQCDVLEQAWAAEARATRLQQERDEAYERLKPLSEVVLPWGNVGSGMVSADAVLAARDLVRRLAGPEKEKL